MEYSLKESVYNDMYRVKHFAVDFPERYGEVSQVLLDAGEFFGEISVPENLLLVLGRSVCQ